MARFRSSLAIGGTGMLAMATRWLAAHSDETLVVARRASGFEADSKMVALDADWRNPAFQQAVLGALQRSARVDAALIWLHEPEPVLPWLLPALGQARIVLVLASTDGRPAIPNGAAPLATVRLGSAATAGGRRWLSHDEISAGAVAAMQDGQSRVVGDLRPAD